MSCFTPTGTTYQVLLNTHTEWAAWLDRFVQPPYLAAPKAPVLTVKPSNTHNPLGQSPLTLPDGVDALWLQPTLGLVFGPKQSKTNQPVSPVNRAIGAINVESMGVMACVLALDVSLPHTSYHRPPVRFNARDGFLALGPLVPLPGIDAPGLAATLREASGTTHTLPLDDWRLPPDALIEALRGFMDLTDGDVLLLGQPVLPGGARVLGRAGERWRIEAPGLGGFEVSIQTEGASA